MKIVVVPPASNNSLPLYVERKRKWIFVCHALLLINLNIKGKKTREWERKRQLVLFPKAFRASIYQMNENAKMASTFSQIPDFVINDCQWKSINSWQNKRSRSIHIRFYSKDQSVPFFFVLSNWPRLCTTFDHIVRMLFKRRLFSTNSAFFIRRYFLSCFFFFKPAVTLRKRTCTDWNGNITQL